MTFNKIWCIFGIHKESVKRGQHDVYHKYKALGYSHVDAWAMATPTVCRHCDRVEPNYQRIMDRLDKKYSKFVRIISPDEI